MARFGWSLRRLRTLIKNPDPPRGSTMRNEYRLACRSLCGPMATTLDELMCDQTHSRQFGVVRATSGKIGNDENRLVKLTADRPFADPEKASPSFTGARTRLPRSHRHTCRNQAYTYRIATRRTRVDRDSRLPKAGVQFVSADRAYDGRWRGKRH